MGRLHQVEDFLHNNCNRDNTLSDNEIAMPLTRKLEEYFESRECIDFDTKEKKMTLHFDIFLKPPVNHEQTSDSTVIVMDNLQNDVDRVSQSEVDFCFLECLTNEKSLASLCKHPYITAFLDIHYSTSWLVNPCISFTFPPKTVVLRHYLS